jgi:DNA-binding IclR family transcriptional regulator
VSHSDQQFGLSELARALHISKPTCLGIVTTLTENGYLSVDEHSKRYQLGPALIAAGRAVRFERATPTALLNDFREPRQAGRSHAVRAKKGVRA